VLSDAYPERKGSFVKPIRRHLERGRRHEGLQKRHGQRTQAEGPDEGYLLGNVLEGEHRLETISWWEQGTGETHEHYGGKRVLDNVIGEQSPKFVRGFCEMRERKI